MLTYPHIDPVAVQIGPLAVHWYGLTYLVAFALFYALARVRIRQQPFAGVSMPGPWTARDVEDLLFMGVMGAILGGRLGYCLFYKPEFYAAHPLEVFAIWKGGMSFHGGMLGTIAAMGLFAKLRGRRFFEVADLVAPCVPTGLAAGRVGNFINGELWGRLADPSLPWAMVFPQAGAAPRHPSQIYQFLLEGLLLFVLLWLYARKPRGLGQVSGAFLFGYGLLRFVAEYFREPDDFLGLLAMNLSMGQWLCVPMMAAGLLIWLWGRKQPRHL
ncbi:prolipoprotein diacylglyceryl transferase [Comamonas serinivorans]|uniref:Phosphatidylglycerol--prolipoprotein diacylglyceryl transferase n=1 Tax=Comamonas serinivorans TaxID=1082851 RepID=A0A1Y0EP23_9BURK|nr:prolipoprotein diacylglyceryl transferase [Comamonas serinivorans]ARU05151.1 prolipoprotein diacylglyceryl transferase [Comamonas serinivorans]